MNTLTIILTKRLYKMYEDLIILNPKFNYVKQIINFLGSTLDVMIQK